MKTNAISRINPEAVRAKLDDFGTDGTFRNDGTLVRGEMGTITKDELAYRIWRQSQDTRIKEPELRKIWALKTPRSNL